MQPLKIALIRQRYTAFGGAERFVANAMMAMQSQGTKLTIVTRQWQPQSGIEVLTIDPFYVGSVWRDWGFARAVCTELRKKSFDLVQSHERIACCDVFRAGDGVHREWLAQRRRIQGAMGRLGVALNPYHHYVKAAEKRLFCSPRLKAVICISKMVKEEIRGHFGVGEERLHVIYNGIDTESFHPRLKQQYRASVRAEYGVPLGAPLFLFVGSGFERKGVGTLLQAMADVPDSAHLIVVGKDKRLKHFVELAARHQLAERVHFTGAREDVKPFYGAADALVFPTLYEPFGNVTLEAMACGLPVITSRKAGSAELIENGVNGFVCDALDVPALAASMRLLAAPDRCAEMGLAARAAAEPLTFEAMSSRLTVLYQGLLAS
jgi:UDP-glucose:(heptosyl)LPS alpha-1,3-glucosyltransferase